MSGGKSMFCSNCGTEIRDDASFCFKCGEKVFKEENYQETIHEEPQEAFSAVSRVRCLRCGSHHLQYVTESKTQGGNFNGVIPQNKYQTIITTTNTSYWVCHTCGYKFKSLDELQKELKGMESNRTKGRVMLGTGIVFLLIACGSQDPLMLLIMATFGSLFAFLSVILLLYGRTSKIEELKKECEMYDN